MISIDTRNREIFVNRLLEEFMAAIQGNNQERYVGVHPEQAIFVGKLSPQNARNSDLSSETNINRIGFEFFTDAHTLINGVLEVVPQGHFFYRVYPSLTEQRAHMIRNAGELNQRLFASFDELVAWVRQEKPTFTTEVEEVYQRKTFEDLPLTIKLNDVYLPDKQYGQIRFSSEHEQDNQLTNYIQGLIESVRADIHTYSIINEPVTIEHVVNEKAWNSFIKRYSTETKYPKWDFGIECEIRSYQDGRFKVAFYLFNLTTADDSSKDKSRVNTLYNSGIHVTCMNFTPHYFELPYFEDDYKYNKKQAAIGVNCTVEYNEQKKVFQTTHLPVFEQKRLITSEHGDAVKAKFQELINNPVQKLMAIYNAMQAEYTNWQKKADQQKKANVLTSSGYKQLEKEIQGFYFEIQRFKNGIRVIEEYSIIREAFIYMNRAFASTSKKYDAWRLFQIVFIVSLIPDIGISEYGESDMRSAFLDKVDLLYFPTGGGKTEAFLGITVFTLFFDRLRAKKVGVSAFIKYPLRLLSIQQVQRVAFILASAELIRREHADMEGDPFSLGYFVGDRNTPNAINEKNIQKLESQSPQQLLDEYQILDLCPFCNQQSIVVEYIKDTNRLIHRCSHSSCLSGGVLPIYMVDREIYRYLPSVIISTIDKFATVGVQLDFRSLLGEAQYCCTKHGYTSRRVCVERGFCKDPMLLEQVTLKDAAPSLFIQDELHLIRESLGVYDAHYESFISDFIQHLSSSRKKVKIIGATATISSYELQINHLYLKEAIRFPCESPDINQNFYAKVNQEELHRKILGFAPFGAAILVNVVRSMKYLKQILWNYYKNPKQVMDIEGMKLSSEEEALRILEDYWIFLEYNNVKLDGNRVLGMIETQIDTELAKEGIQKFEPRKMTGDDSFQEVRKVLAEVENTKNVFEGINMIAATNMISHGVDADRFNLMFFFGMPTNTAEYIQAYSRVGRKHPGLVVMIMRPTRERDQSYLKNFIKFHEFKDILVEPVPINRWASKAIERTFPGILSGLILNYYDLDFQTRFNTNVYMMEKLKAAITNGWLKEEDVLINLQRAYQSNLRDLGKIYDEWITRSVHQFFELIQQEDFSQSNDRDTFIGMGMERLGFLKPMNSLRDTDANLIVELR